MSMSMPNERTVQKTFTQNMIFATITTAVVCEGTCYEYVLSANAMVFFKENSDKIVFEVFNTIF